MSPLQCPACPVSSSDKATNRFVDAGAPVPRIRSNCPIRSGARRLFWATNRPSTPEVACCGTPCHARETLFRGGREWVALQGRVVIIVDDGIATGATTRVACQVARRLGARRVVVLAGYAGKTF